MPQPGVLGKQDVTPSQDIVLYTTPASTVSTVNVSLCNRATSATKMRLSIGTAGVPAATDFIEYDAVIRPGGVLERTGLVLGPTEKLIVRTTAVGISARAYGFEEAA